MVQGRVRAPIGVGARRRDQRPLLAVERPEFDLHSLCRATMRGVQDVSAEFGRHRSDWLGVNPSGLS